MFQLLKLREIVGQCNTGLLCVISGFCHEVDDICILLGYYAV